MNNENHVRQSVAVACPLYQDAHGVPVGMPVPKPPCPAEEIVPLRRFLEANTVVSETIVFPRGTMTTDGRLDLCKQDIGSAGCEQIMDSLRRNTHVRSLLLGTDGIGDAGARAVADLIGQRPQLQIAYLGCNGITENGAAVLAQAVSLNQTLSGLWLKRNPIGTAGAMQLAKMLQTNSHLRVLDLVNTQIGFSGLEALTKTLIAENSTLERLHLGGNQFEPPAAELLAKLLIHNRSLKSLLIDVNCLGDAGALLLANALKQNRTLQHFDMASNGLTETGATALFEAVATHPAFLHLGLGFSPSTKVLGAVANHLGDRGAASAAKFLPQNGTLRSLDLTKTGIGVSGRQNICEAMRSNSTLTS
ncbi:MAG: leucine-rich repeat, ribonuclease inhibitor subtype [Planctomycetaceae bacterium]|nr:leucine-rich repeat, ribonuclease inhibitor subtype [Planctomycetaceae bacterium]